MAYCVKCGVELDKQLTSCPLCTTPVYLPEELDEDTHSTYPERKQRKRTKQVNLVPSKTFVYLMTFIIVIPLIVCLMIDVRRNHTISWSFYPVSSLILFWILIAYPALIKRYSLLKVLTIDIYSVVFSNIFKSLFRGFILVHLSGSFSFINLGLFFTWFSIQKEPTYFYAYCSLH